MKIYKKKDLAYKNGYLVKGDKIVTVDNDIIDLLNKLDVDIQRHEWEADRKAQSEYIGKMVDDEFTAKSEYTRPVISVETPTIDGKVKEAMAVIEEMEAQTAADEINKRLIGMRPVVQFVQEDFVVPVDQYSQHRFDLPTIGNPLEIDLEKLTELVVRAYE